MSARWLVRRLAVMCVMVCSAMCAGSAGASDERVFKLSIKGNSVPSHQRTIRVTKGAVASIEAIADRAVVLHIHGLKLEMELKPETSAKFLIPTRATGRFRIELHETGAVAKSHHHGPPLAFLEVMPP